MLRAQNLLSPKKPRPAETGALTTKKEACSASFFYVPEKTVRFLQAQFTMTSLPLTLREPIKV